MKFSIEKILIEPIMAFFKKLINFLPNLFSSIIILVIGIVTAGIIRFVVLRFLKIVHFDIFCERIGVSQTLKKGGIREIPSSLTARILYWITISIFFIISLNSLRVPSVEQLMTQLLLYLPNVFVSVIIVIFGYMLANFLGRATLIASVNAGLRMAGALSHVVRLGVFVLSITMAMEQLGIGRATIIITYGIIAGGAVLGLAIAFGLGGKDIAKDYLEKRIKQEEGEEEKEKPDDIQHI